MPPEELTRSENDPLEEAMVRTSLIELNPENPFVTCTVARWISSSVQKADLRAEKIVWELKMKLRIKGCCCMAHENLIDAREWLSYAENDFGVVEHLFKTYYPKPLRRVSK